VEPVALKKPLNLPKQSSIERMAGGIIGVHDNISPTTRPLGALSVCRNLIRYGETAAMTRPGREKIGLSLGSGPVLGVAGYFKSDGTKRLIAGVGNKWKAYHEGQWSDIYTPTAGKPFEAVMFGDMLILTNGTDKVQKYEGESSTSDLDGSPPKSPFIATAYRRVFLVTLPHLLVFSDVGNAEVWDPEELNDAGQLPINDKDGDEIKWVQLYKTNMVIWKRNSLHELHGPELAYLSPRWKVYNIAKLGTPNGRTVAEVNGVLYWLSDTDGNTGIVRWDGGVPRLISSPVNNVMEAINWSYISEACATAWNGYYILSVPTGDSTEANQQIFYNTVDQSFWLGDGWLPTKFTVYRPTGQEEVVMGDQDGSVYKIGGTKDNGVAIHVEAVLGPTALDINTREKRVRRGYISVSLLEE
jgi:hypothetical protein